MGTINLSSLVNLPLLSFFFSTVLGIFGIKFTCNAVIKKIITYSVLVLIGLKGGIALPQNFSNSSGPFFSILFFLSLWGFLQPVLSFFVLKRVTALELPTIAVIGACFGSVSMITFITGIAFLENLDIYYQKITIPILAIMEFPAIISGIYLAKRVLKSKLSIGKTIFHSVVNLATLSILFGLVMGVLLGFLGVSTFSQASTSIFNVLVALFLFDLGGGISTGFKNKFSFSVFAFGCYMPLLSALVGLFVSYFLQLDIGTATLVVLLCASASYIAVPAAMRLILPQADERVYLPLSLGVAFPFNVVLGIPLYYYCASKLLG